MRIKYNRGMFIDQTEIRVRSGKGGDGMVHFRREKYVPRGGPDGGDGGKGGDVIFEVTKHINTLYQFRNNRLYAAEDGSNGGPNNRFGKSGEDLIIKVPAGTMIYDTETGNLIGDLVKEGQTLVVCAGGRGGRGNTHFKNSRNKVPHIAEKGEPASEQTLRLELKLIADVGIVGVPNAGKSTLLSVATNAKPKIASYAFTTLEPNLGVVAMDNFETFVMADIPGLIEGAHMGVGLGHDFLRHVQRTRILVHMIDGSSVDPVGDYIQINAELSLFDADLGDKPQIVVLNKIDLPDVADIAPLLEKEFKKLGVELIKISAATNQNVRALLYKVLELIQSLPPVEFEEELPVYTMESDPNYFEIEETEEGWVVHGQAIERAAAMTYWEHDQAIYRFQRIMEVIGIDEALRKEGVQPGDTVFIGEVELQWEE